MRRTLLLLGALAGLAACGDGQPLFDEEDEGVAEGADTDDDGVPDSTDDDDDADGIDDDDERDTDGDGLIDDRDGDDDNDEVRDADERDTDDDGIIDDRDPDDDGDGTLDEDEGAGGAGGDPTLPPGTDGPSSRAGITRFEADDGEGGGFVRDVEYDAATDTFRVDNLAFDGDNVYTRDDAVPSLGPGDNPAVYAVYEAAQVVRDADGDPVDQFDYRAIYGVSAVEEDGEPRTRFAIVRSGSFVNYGFGGFLYERAGPVELPTTGQAVYAGDYAGMRVFDGRGGLEYTQGDVSVAIDFEDFNDGSGVRGRITDREAFTIDGDAIPLGGEGELALPDMTFVVGPGATTSNGEISAGIQSYVAGEGGGLDVYEEGTYYAIVAGEGASEVVGVFVVESEDPRFEGVTAQETGGFIVYR